VRWKEILGSTLGSKGYNRAIILIQQTNYSPTSNLVLMTVTGIRHTPLNDRANMPRNMASSGPGSPDVKFDFNQWREEK
jgi:hypothetical protein